MSPHTSISHLYPDMQQTENCGQDVYSCFAAAAVHVQHLMWLLNEDRKLFQLLPSARFPNDRSRKLIQILLPKPRDNTRTVRTTISVCRVKDTLCKSLHKTTTAGYFRKSKCFPLLSPPFKLSSIFFCSNKRLPENESTCHSGRATIFESFRFPTYLPTHIVFASNFFVFVFYDSPPRKSIFDREEIQSPKIKSPPLD